MPASISIKAKMAKGLPQALISPVRLHQILMNLSINARDAIDGAGMVEIKAESVVADGSKACGSCHRHFSGAYLMISVRDTGSGISQENLWKIFDPFFTTKEMGRGSGLGLSVLHGLVHSANGHIEVLTALGRGTEFRIYLPAHLQENSQENKRLAQDAKPDPEPARLGGNIMVVDDEPSIVDFMTAQLERLGCKVIGLTSATEALRRFQDEPYCVEMVITDQTMPELTGAELARAMLARRPDIPIVMCTGYSKVIDEECARQIGIRRLLIKPVLENTLIGIVAELLPTKVSTIRGAFLQE